MVLVNGIKYACERCIRGHRVTTCTHTDQPLMMIKPKGRPSTTCDLCKELRKNKRIVDKLLEEGKQCTCGRLRKRLEQQKLKDEAKARSKELKRRNKLLGGGEQGNKSNVKIDLLKQHNDNTFDTTNYKRKDSVISERRMSALSMNSFTGTGKSISMLNNNPHLFGTDSSVHSYSDVSSMNSPTSIDGGNSFINGFSSSNPNNFISNNSNLFTKNYSDSHSNLFNVFNSNNYLDSNVGNNNNNNNTSPQNNDSVHAISSPVNTSGKITKDYHRVNSLASISSTQSQHYLEQSFSSPQSPSFYNTTHITSNLTANTTNSNGKKDISISSIIPTNLSNMSPDWLSGVNNSENNDNNNMKNSKSNDYPNNNIENNLNDIKIKQEHDLDDMNGLLDSIMNSSALQGMSRASYLLKQENPSNHSLNNPLIKPEPKDDNILDFDVTTANKFTATNTNETNNNATLDKITNAQKNLNNMKNITTNVNDGVGILSLTPGLLDMDANNNFSGANSLLNIPGNDNDFNASSFPDSQLLKNDQDQSLQEPKIKNENYVMGLDPQDEDFAKHSDSIYSSYNDILKGMVNDMSSSNNYSNVNMDNSTIDVSMNSPSNQFGNENLLKDKIFLNNTMNSDLDQQVIQNVIKSEYDDTFNI
ncbi:hypothetical protein TPHA_0D00690 [Tetrapisispora phaffii CBS 4417]|uniref:Copper-fist domain-containing protein n=1 Tax=Tetrapisispora phaffii (strain ATCC 24235 / CBS 4417 / NBRC 1672 / NRRL Y-8282 / UCD 70-5) TaxID=1071381 RepID=G8BS91_TETPH|nr:hypothetical protein TPHA_0D00690 [Tetrapisispora phaffii CBS 4417]CCE62712.1 hypothetical protein TPHA_0D00690 [Tetrapisispora phaffii CBS 4417]